MRMEVLRENEFNQLVWEAPYQLITLRRFDVLDMTDELYQQEALFLADMVEKYKPYGILMDHRKFSYPIIPSLQEWLNKNIFPRLLASGFYKGAFLISTDFFTQVSVEQTLSEKEGQKFSIRYFDDETTARQWLFA